jgi:transposase
VGLCRPLLDRDTTDALQRTHDLREVFNAVRWLVKTGAPWREIPGRFGPWHTVYTRYRDWCNAGIWHDVLAVLTPNPPVDLSDLSL